LSAFVLAMAWSDTACCSAFFDWRNCHTDVATRPATPMTKLDRKLEYVWMKWPNFDVWCCGMSSLTAAKI
jgi:hypothetical protein